MGVSLTKSTPRYPQKETFPREEIEEISVCKKVEKPRHEFKIIDHRSFLMKDSFSHIKGLKVCFEKYITGIKVSYWLNSQIKMGELMGSGPCSNEDCMIFEEDEYIDHIVCYYDDVALTFIKICTTEGRTKSFGSNKGHYKTVIDLKEEGRAVIGFKGMIGEYLSELWIYHEKLEESFGEITPSTMILDE